MNQIAINDIGTEEDFIRAIDESMREYKNGESVSGIVVQIDRDGILVDIGGKTEGHIPLYEISAENTKHIDPNDFVKIGQKIEAIVLKSDGESGQHTLSIKKAGSQLLLDDIQNKYDIKQSVIAKVKSVVKGGLIVDIGIRAFMPGSQIELNKVNNLQLYIGQELEAKIIEFDRAKPSVVVSRKAFLNEILQQDRMIEFAKISVGQIFTGSISGIVDYGVFVEMGVLTGLVHISKMKDLTPESFTLGQQVEVRINEIDFNKNRLSLVFYQ